MRRLRLEIVLGGALAVALVAVLLAGPDEQGGTLAGAGIPAPCDGAPRVTGLAALDRDADLDRFVAAVEELRGLEFADAPEPEYLADPAFEARVAAMPAFREGEGEVLNRVLAELGAIPPGYDLERELSEAAATGIVGYYDPETNELVVRGTGEADGFGALERITLVHELEHALADQALGLRDLDDPSAGADALAAYRALVEGDAELVTEMYAAQALGLGDQLELGLTAFPLLFGPEIPYFLERSLTMPYLEGTRFACALFERGGWEAVNAAYASPPTTTAEILFPERYPAERPVDPADPEGPPRSWRHDAELTFGAADLLFLLQAPAADPSLGVRGARKAASGWAAGELHIWSRGDGTALGLTLVERPGGSRICETLVDWYRAGHPRGLPGAMREGDAFSVFHGDGGAALVRCVGDEVRLGLGPDLAVARAAAT